MRFITEHGKAVDIDDRAYRGVVSVSIEGSPCRGGWGCCGSCDLREFEMSIDQVERLRDHLTALIEDQAAAPLSPC